MRYTRPRSALPPPLRRFPHRTASTGSPPRTTRLGARTHSHAKAAASQAGRQAGRCTGGGGGGVDKGSLPSSAPHTHARPPPAVGKPARGGMTLLPPTPHQKDHREPGGGGVIRPGGASIFGALVVPNNRFSSPGATPTRGRVNDPTPGHTVTFLFFLPLQNVLFYYGPECY